jgi:hypothetical protein
MRSVTSPRPSVTVKKNRSAVTVAVQAGRRAAAGEQVQLIVPQILCACCVRRTTEENGEVPDGADIGCLGPRRELADRHVLDHAPA